jgi:hypothetical protein
VPDEVFWQKVKDALIENYGRELTVPEIEAALRDENSVPAKLAKEAS